MNRKVLVTVIFLLITAFYGFLFQINGFEGPTKWIIRTCSFLFAGSLVYFIILKVLQPVSTPQSTLTLLLLFFSSATGSVLSSLLSPVSFNLLYVVSGIAATMLPGILVATYAAYVDIPKQNIKTWHLKNSQLSRSSIVYLASVPLTIKMLVAKGTRTEYKYPVTVPAQIELGKVFHHFLQHLQNKKGIELPGPIAQDSAWQFYREQYKGAVLYPLDPDLNSWDNHLGSNSVLLVKCVDPEEQTNLLEA